MVNVDDNPNNDPSDISFTSVDCSFAFTGLASAINPLSRESTLDTCSPVHANPTQTSHHQSPTPSYVNTTPRSLRFLSKAPVTPEHRSPLRRGTTPTQEKRPRNVAETSNFASHTPTATGPSRIPISHEILGDDGATPPNNARADLESFLLHHSLTHLYSGIQITLQAVSISSWATSLSSLGVAEALIGDLMDLMVLVQG
ncbi:hypothetical protein B0H34DRAFT_161567 [Crassisporium funariophilum]|nr:hypothetical protein B0H34DRAFT_161567 [Crassisporium funariophilum]